MNMKELTLLNFSDVYPDEASCVEALRRFREKFPVWKDADRFQIIPPQNP